MDLREYIDSLQRQLVVAAGAGGEEANALAERLIAPLDAAIRLTLLDVLAMAAEEITCALAPGSVEVRLRGRDPEFVVIAPPVDLDDPPYDDGAESKAPPVTGTPAPGSTDGDDNTMARINLRMPDQLKARIEDAAGREGLSVNAWLVRASAAAVDRTDWEPRVQRRVPRGGQRYTGWAR